MKEKKNRKKTTRSREYCTTVERNVSLTPVLLSQVRVRRLEGLDELSWGELEGENSKLEPFKGRLAALKEAWDEGVFDRWVVSTLPTVTDSVLCTRLRFVCKEFPLLFLNNASTGLLCSVKTSKECY